MLNLVISDPLKYSNCYTCHVDNKCLSYSFTGDAWTPGSTPDSCQHTRLEGLQFTPDPQLCVSVQDNE